jgi:drug/metabolite transporter (DMT)-like permease
LARFKNWQLFAVCVLVWGTTWHAITYQISDLAPELGVALRFALAGATVLAFAAWRGDRLRFGATAHAAMALQGTFLYGVSYVCVYHAERFVASGLVAVGYSASPLITGIGAAALFGVAVGGRFVAGGLLGLAGVALIFWPEIARPADGEKGTWGALFTVASVLLSSVGSLAASRNRQRGVPLLPAMGFGMLYGAVAAALVALALGRHFAWPSAPSWWLSMAWLAFAGSALAFACFLTLQDRLGPGPAGTIGVMTPLLALVVSLLFEGFRPDLLTGLGVTLAVIGNARMLLPAAASAPLTGGVPAAE